MRRKRRQAGGRRVSLRGASPSARRSNAASATRLSGALPSQSAKRRPTMSETPISAQARTSASPLRISPLASAASQPRAVGRGELLIVAAEDRLVDELGLRHHPVEVGVGAHELEERAQAPPLGLEPARRVGDGQRQVPAQAPAHAQDELAQHVLLAAEIEVECALADGGLGRDGADGGLGEALAADLALGSVEDLLAGALAAPGLGRGQGLGRARIRHDGTVIFLACLR